MSKETLSFAQLAEWSRQRWVAGQHEAANNVMARAEAQAAIEHPGKVVVRNITTGVLDVIDGPQLPAQKFSDPPLKTPEELEEDELEKLQREEDEEKARAQGSLVADAAKTAAKAKTTSNRR